MLSDWTFVNEIYYLGNFFNLIGLSSGGPSPAYMQMSFITKIWVQSSAIAVLSLFCAFILVASSLTEELNLRTKEETFFTAKSSTVSMTLDSWFDQFHQLLLLVERIKECFNPILVITVFYFFVKFTDQVFNTIKDVCRLGEFGLTIWLFVLIIRFGTIVIVCQQLQYKVFTFTYASLSNSFSYIL